MLTRRFAKGPEDYPEVDDVQSAQLEDACQTTWPLPQPGKRSSVNRIDSDCGSWITAPPNRTTRIAQNRGSRRVDGRIRIRHWQNLPVGFTCPADPQAYAPMMPPILPCGRLLGRNSSSIRWQERKKIRFFRIVCLNCSFRFIRFRAVVKRLDQAMREADAQLVRAEPSSWSDAKRG